RLRKKLRTFVWKDSACSWVPVLVFFRKIGAIPTRNHRSHFVERTCRKHHHDMNDDECAKQENGYKMKSAGCLASAEPFRQRQYGIHAGRHGQPRNYNHREKPEKHHAIGQFLHRIVCFPLLEAKLEMVEK